MSKPQTGKTKIQSSTRTWLGRYPGRTLQRFGAMLSGFWLANLFLSFVWPEPDKISPSNQSQVVSLKTSPSLIKPVSILLLGIEDSNERQPSLSKSKIKSDLFMILLVDFLPPDDLRIHQIPLQMLISLPGEQNKQSLSDVYTTNQIRLISDIVTEYLDIPKFSISRYIAFSRERFKSILENFEPYSILFEESVFVENIIDNHSFLIRKGTQKLTSNEITNYLLNSTNKIDHAKKRERARIIYNLLIDKIRKADTKMIESGIEKFISDKKTNLSTREAMNLIAYVIRSKKNIKWTSFSLMTNKVKPNQDK